MYFSFRKTTLRFVSGVCLLLLQISYWLFDKKIPSQDLFVYFLHGGKISLLICLLFTWRENLNLIWIKFEFGLNTKF